MCDCSNKTIDGVTELDDLLITNDLTVVGDLTAGTITAPVGSITTLASTTGNITSVNSTNVTTTNVIDPTDATNYLKWDAVNDLLVYIAGVLRFSVSSSSQFLHQLFVSATSTSAFVVRKADTTEILKVDTSTPLLTVTTPSLFTGRLRQDTGITSHSGIYQTGSITNGIAVNITLTTLTRGATYLVCCQIGFNPPGTALATFSADDASDTGRFSALVNNTMTMTNTGANWIFTLNHAIVGTYTYTFNVVKVI